MCAVLEVTRRAAIVATSYQHKESDLSAARCKALGLTAYGNTEEEAFEALNELVHKFVRTYLELGQLEDRLEQAGIVLEETIETLEESGIPWEPTRNKAALVEA